MRAGRLGRSRPRSRPARAIGRPLSRPARAIGRPLGGLVALAVALAASVVLVRLGNGDFGSAYDLEASFSKVSAGIHPGSEVAEHGVQIGSVGRIELRGGRALLTFRIGSRYAIPPGSTATIEPLNLFGADEVSITPPAPLGAGGGGGGALGASGAGKRLPPGGRITHTRVLDELGSLFAAADPLLSSIDTTDLSSAVSELAAAYGGQGHEIATSLEAGTALSSLLARTTQAQLAAIDALTAFTTAVAGEGPTLNHLAGDANRTLPLFNAAEADYARLLSDLGAFSSRLAALVTDYRPSIDTILSDGGNVLRVLLAKRSDLASLVSGLAQYAYRFAHGASSATLPDGSRFGYFKTFIVWTDVERFVCGLLAPAKAGLGFLRPLQAAVLSGNTLLDCSSELASFNAAQKSSSVTPGGPVAGTGGSSVSPSATGAPRTAAGGLANSSAARQAASGLYGLVGQPEAPQSESIAGYLDSLLPAATGSLP